MATKKFSDLSYQQQLADPRFRKAKNDPRYATTHQDVIVGNLAKEQIGGSGISPLSAPSTKTSFNFTRSETPLEKAQRGLIDIQRTDMPDESALRQKALQARQQQIDMTNKIFDKRLEEQQALGAGALGSQRALASITGVLGSPRGQAQRQGVQSANAKAEQAVQDERQFRLENIFQEIDKSVEERFATQRAQAISGREAEVGFLEEQAQRDLGLAQSFIQGGGDPDILSDEDYNKLRELVPEMDNFEFDLFVNDNKPKDVEDIEITSKWENGNFVRIVQKPDGTIETRTYTADQLGLLSEDAAIDPAFVDIGGTKYFYDKSNLQLDATGKPILQPLGSTSKSKAPSQTSDLTSAKNDMRQALSTVIGSDGFISPDDYKTARVAWIQAGYNPATFDKEYAGFRNPSNLNYVTEEF